MPTATQPKTKISPRAMGPTGSEILIAALKERGIRTVFGINGAAIMPVFDALYEDEELIHIGVAHEQGGIHMAEGYARATGRPGVVMVTSGPGATNLTTGLANAMMDSTPIVAIAGQVMTGLIGRDAFQEIDFQGLASRVTKHVYRPRKVAALSGMIDDAFDLAAAGRCGPVAIDLPKDVCLAESRGRATGSMARYGRSRTAEGHPLQIDRAMARLNRAERPMVLIGGGLIAAEATDHLVRLADLLDLPVASSLMGLGGFPGDDERFLGMAGMHGQPAANMALAEADLVICLGTRLNDRLTGQPSRFTPRADLIHVDIDPAEIGKNLRADIPIVGHLGPVLEAMTGAAEDWPDRPNLSGWWAAINDWRERYPLAPPTSDRSGGEEWLDPREIVTCLNGLLDDEAIIATGVGQHQMWTAQYYRFNRPRSFITSGGLGTMGFGLPAALGAQLGCPERQVVCIDGDGSFQMNIQELTTAVQLGLPVVSIILNNSSLGMVKQWQKMFSGGRLAGTPLAPPRFDLISQAFGGLGRRIERPEELEETLTWALKAARENRRPVVIDAIIDPEAMVLPLVPAGRSNSEFIFRTEDRS